MQNYKEQYEFIVSFKSKTTAELHHILMATFDLAEKELGTIQFTREKPMCETFDEYEKKVCPLIKKIGRLHSILTFREQNESKRMIYEENSKYMLDAGQMRNEYSSIMNKYYKERVQEIKDITQIKSEHGDSTIAEQYIREKIELEEVTEREYFNMVLLRYLMDITTCRAAIQRMTDNSSSDMY